MNRILYSAIQTPDGTILESKYRHDYVTYTDKNGHDYMLDGGLDYQRYNIVEEAPHKDLTIYDDGSHEVRRKYLTWGSNYDKDMNRLPKTIYKTIENLDTDHIEAILDGNWCKSEFYLEVFKNELKFRKNV